MRKILLLLIFLYGHLYALERESTLKMYHQIFSALVSKPMIHVYTDDKEYKKVFITSKRMILSDDPGSSDIILITHQSTYFKMMREQKSALDRDVSPILFVTDYRILKNFSDIVGAFYWKKGRSQLLFIKKRLDDYNITLPKEYEKFTVDDL